MLHDRLYYKENNSDEGYLTLCILQVLLEVKVRIWKSMREI
jgi:hypothetical protein